MSMISPVQSHYYEGSPIDLFLQGGQKVITVFVVCVCDCSHFRRASVC